MEHIATTDFLAFFSWPQRTLHARIAGHLLGGCSACLAEARQVLLDQGVPLPPPSTRDLSLILHDQAGLLQEERAKAAARWARIAELDEKKRLASVEKRRGVRNYGLAAYVLDEAEALAARGKGEKATELVRLADAIGASLPTRLYGAGPLADLRLRQHTLLATIKRRALDFVGALEALAKAEHFRDRGVDPAERARYFRDRASLLTDLGEFEEAAKSAGHAASIYAGMLDLPNRGKASGQEALAVSLFEPQSALALAEAAIPLLVTEPKSLLLAALTKGYCLAKLGQTREAAALLASQRELIRQAATVEIDLWFKYIEALILKAKGQVDDADVLLRLVAHGFREEGDILAMLIQHLERIRIKAETGRWKSAVNIAVCLTPELASLGLRNDLLGMWANLQDALAQRHDVVNEIEDFFRRRWHAPSRPARR
ncbi:MAG TPA: hypothetical protein DD490_28325 [Acidobacteria bacterium]|nr:hypothetical protein [Acidobacteriota bacterium]